MGGGVILQQKQHDGCEIQLLEGEDTHTLLLVGAPLKCDSYNCTAKICINRVSELNLTGKGRSQLKLLRNELEKKKKSTSNVQGHRTAQHRRDNTRSERLAAKCGEMVNY